MAPFEGLVEGPSTIIIQPHSSPAGTEPRPQCVVHPVWAGRGTSHCPPGACVSSTHMGCGFQLNKQLQTI